MADFPAGWPQHYKRNPAYWPLESRYPEGGELTEEPFHEGHLPSVGIVCGTGPTLSDRRYYVKLTRRIREQDREIRKLNNDVAVLRRALEVNDPRVLNLLYCVLPPDLPLQYFPLSERARELRNLAEFDFIELRHQVDILSQQVTRAEHATERATRVATHVLNDTFRHPTITRPMTLASEPEVLNLNNDPILRTHPNEIARGQEDTEPLVTQGTLQLDPQVKQHLRSISRS